MAESQLYIQEQHKESDGVQIPPIHTIANELSLLVIARPFLFSIVPEDKHIEISSDHSHQAWDVMKSTKG
jgi:hypothetical protein